MMFGSIHVLCLPKQQNHVLCFGERLQHPLKASFCTRMSIRALAVSLGSAEDSFI